MIHQCFHIMLMKKGSNHVYTTMNHLHPLWYIHLHPTDKYEIINIISSLDSNKSTGPNSIPNKILKLHKNDISTELSDIFNVSFLTGVFPSKLKIAKVIPIHKKQFKLDYSNYRPISLLSNHEKILEKLMYSRILKFLMIIIPFTPYNLLSDKNIPKHML